jgi:hypothetical protein
VAPLPSTSPVDSARCAAADHDHAGGCQLDHLEQCPYGMRVDEHRSRWHSRVDGPGHRLFDLGRERLDHCILRRAALLPHRAARTHPAHDHKVLAPTAVSQCDFGRKQGQPWNGHWRPDLTALLTAVSRCRWASFIVHHRGAMSRTYVGLPVRRTRSVGGSCPSGRTSPRIPVRPTWLPRKVTP